jgi:hypothetical protein
MVHGLCDSASHLTVQSGLVAVSMGFESAVESASSGVST